MPKASSFELGKTTQAAGTWKAKGKHIEICEEAATCSVQDLRENILSEMRAIGKKIIFFITGDKFRTFLDMPSFAPSWFFDASGFVEMLWNLNGGIVFRRSRYEKWAGGAGSRTLSHWRVRSQEAQVIPQCSIFSLSLSLSLFHRYDRSHFADTLEISGNCYTIDRMSKHRGPVMSHAIFRRCWQMTVNTWLEKIFFRP